MIGPKNYSAVGSYPLTDVSESEAGSLVVQTRLVSGSGLSYGFSKRVTGSDVLDASCPRTHWMNALSGADVAPATATVATATPIISEVQAKGCQVLLVITANTTAGVIQVELQPIVGAL